MPRSSKKSSHKKHMPPSNLPPKLDVTPTIRHRYRYLASTASSGSTTIGELFGALGSTCTITNSSVTCWYTSVRIHSISLFAPSGTTSGTSVLWNSPIPGIGRDTEPDTYTPSGITVANKLVALPPSHSFAGDWMNSSLTATLSIFTIVCPAGTIIDLDVSATNSNVYGPYQRAVVTGTLAFPYYLALDGVTTNLLAPVGLPTTH